MKMKPLPKFLAIALVIGSFGFGINKAMEKGLIPKGHVKIQSPDVKDALKSGAKIVRIGTDTWPGHAAGQFFNGGFAATKVSRYFKEYGILVEFVLNDDFDSSMAAWKAGKIDVMWTTADAFPTLVDAIKDYEPKIILQADWSRGGDAIVVQNGIETVKDLRGKKIAFALGTPSHSLLLNTLQAGNLHYTDITPVTAPSAVDAASMFKAGKVDAAVVWSPDDQDCVDNVAGSKVLVNTKSAGNTIADVFFAKKEWIDANKDIVKGLTEGWFKGAAEINTDPQAKTEAMRIVGDGLNLQPDMVKKIFDNARLTTYGDNVNFFDLNGDFNGVKGQDLYDKMHKIYAAINLSPDVIPAWRNVIYTNAIREMHFDGPGYEAEGGMQFSAPTKAMQTAAAYASKPISVTYASGSDKLTPEGKTKIDMEFADTAKQFSRSRIRIEGNTDNVGTMVGVRDVQGILLSQKRANSVADYLVSKYGFDRKRFVIVGNGPYHEAADNNTAEGRAMNRRTEFFLLNQ